MTDPPSPRPPRRFARRVLLVLLVAAVAPLLGAAWAARSLFEGALQLAPPLEPLLARAAEALERRAADPPRVDEPHGAELRLAQAELARRHLLDRLPRDFLLALAATGGLVGVAAWLLGRRLSRPVEALAAGMARYARGELGHEVRVPAGRD